jgi:hypothetical protein
LKSANIQSFGIMQVQDQFKLPVFELYNRIDIAQKIKPVTIRTLIPSVITGVGQVTGQKTGQIQGQKQGQVQEQKQVQPQILKIEPKPPVPVPKPKLPVIPVIPLPSWGFAGGGGTGHNLARGGKRFREIQSYDFSVVESARATKKLLKRGSNISTGSTSILGKSMGEIKPIGLPKSLTLPNSEPKKKKGKK